MNRIFVGGISPKGEDILRSYLNAFMPDAIIEPLKAVGIKGRMKNHAKRQDVVLVIIDESLYQACVGVADDVLSLPKVHKYINDDGLNQFLISKFGKLEDAGTVSSDNSFISTSEVVHSIKDDDFANMTFSDSVSETPEKSSDDRIRDLEDKLAKSEMMVRNLTIQLKDSNSDAEDDISAFVSRIRELEETLAKKEEELRSTSSGDYISQEKLSKAEQALGEVSTLKEQLRTANEDKSAVIYERDKLQKEVDTLGTKLADLQTQLASFESIKKDLEDKTNEIVTLNAQLSEKEYELTTRSAEYSGQNAEYGVLHEQFVEQGKKNAELTAEISKIKVKLTDAETQVSNLTIDLESKSKELEKALAEVSELTLKLEQKTQELELAEKDITSANESKMTELESKIAELTSELETLKVKYDEKTSELETERTKAESYLKDIDGFKSDVARLGNKETELEQLSFSIQEQQTTITSLKETIETLKSEIATKTDELAKARDSQLITEESVAVKDKAIDDLMQAKRTLEDKLIEAETSKMKTETDLLACKSEYNSMKLACETKQVTIDEHLATISKLEKQVSSMRENLGTMTANAETISRLENELLEERRKYAGLSSEMDVLKRSDESSRSADLKIEVARLENELERVKYTTVPMDEYKKVQADMLEYKERCTNLELDGVDRAEEINELTNGIFGQLANIAMPKMAYDVSLTDSLEVTDRFYCVASGSVESGSSVYQLLRKTCSTDSRTKYLIVDLVTDTAIDREFGIAQLKSPVNWLIGSEPFRNFLADTKYRNVKVLSTALAYLNDLSLLQVDWQSRFDELSGFADVVIINIGCLNNIVSKVLFNTFSRIMKTHVITKATPVNLRTVILNMTGFGSVDNNVTIDCVNFDDTSSKAMYQRLVQKYKAQVIKDTDVLKF